MIHTFPLVNTPEAFLFLLAQEFQAIPVPPGPGEFQAVPVGGAHGNTKGNKPKQPQHKSRSCGIIRPLGAGDDLQGNKSLQGSQGQHLAVLWAWGMSWQGLLPTPARRKKLWSGKRDNAM